MKSKLNKLYIMSIFGLSLNLIDTVTPPRLPHLSDRNLVPTEIFKGSMSTEYRECYLKLSTSSYTAKQISLAEGVLPPIPQKYRDQIMAYLTGKNIITDLQINKENHKEFLTY